MNLTDIQIRKIEEKCWNKKLLKKDENFIEEINFAKSILYSINVDIKDIQVAFNNILLKLHKSNDYQVYTTLEIDDAELNGFVKEIQKHAIESSVYNKMYVNGTTLKVMCQTMNEFDKSPIDFNEEISFDKIYFIIDESGNKIWLTDMAIYHINKYGFFGGSKCPKYVDPYNLSLILNLQGCKSSPSIHNIVCNKEYRWRSRGNMEKKIIYDIDITNKDKNSGLHFYLYDNGKKLCVKFRNTEWTKKHELTFIKILKIPLFITKEYFDKKWHLCEIVYEEFLESCDDSELNNYIKLCENEVLITRGKLVQEDIFNIILNK